MRARAALAFAAALIAAPASAYNVTISDAPTSNGTLGDGVFKATGPDAVLNYLDLQAALAGSDVSVRTGTRGSQAGDITVAHKIAWQAHSLKLDAFHSIVISKRMQPRGVAGLELATNHGGAGGDIVMGGGSRGSVNFYSTGQPLKINGTSYTLIDNVIFLATDVSAFPSGNYALAHDDVEGTAFTSTPIAVTFTGTFAGLGNRISKLTIATNSTNQDEAMFARLGAGGTIEDLRLSDVSIHNGSGQTTDTAALAVLSSGAIRNVSVSGQVSSGGNGSVGGLVAVNEGSITNSSSAASVSGTSDVTDLGGLVGINNGNVSNSSATGAVSSTAGLEAGGLVATNEGRIFRSFATGDVACGKYCDAGGLVGYNNNGGNIDQTYATGDVSGGDGCEAGGLVGFSVFDFTPNAIANSYATGAVTGNGDGTALSGPRVGGFIGINSTTFISTSYATGAPTATGTSFLVGGFVGEDDATGANANDYWNKTTSGITDPSQGAGSPANDPGITGLSGAQMRAGLPAGFDGAVWAQTPGVNHGLPYLIALPPR